MIALISASSLSAMAAPATESSIKKLLLITNAEEMHKEQIANLPKLIISSIDKEFNSIEEIMLKNKKSNQNKESYAKYIE